MAKKLLSLVLALAMVLSFACISAFAAEEPKVYNGGTNTLELDGEFVADGCDGAIWAKNGAKLTINGTDEDVVLGKVCIEHGYSMAVFADNADVVINGGYYKNENDSIVDPNHVDLIYAKNGANITINGGKFECANPEWTLNCNDKSDGIITVKGGKFYKFDPSNTKVAPAGDTEVIVPAGYSVVKNGDWYEVVSNAKVYDGVTATLNLDGELVADGEDGAIWAKNGAKLTINGTDADTVKAAYVTEYTMALWADGADTEVVINGGYYENEGDPDNADQADLIYAKNGANVTINGGTFKCVTPKWTLNCHDKSNGVITVNGGKFYKFDPSNTSVSPAGKSEIVLGEGCKVVKSGDWYTVIKGEEAKIEFDSASSAVDAENKGALRFVFNVSIPENAKTYFGAYLLPLNIFSNSGIAKAIQVQYDTDVETNSSFSADLVKIPSSKFGTSIYAIPYIRTANGVVTFAGASASVNSAPRQ